MIEDLVNLFDDIIDPEASWSKAIRKTFFIVLFSALIYGGYSTIMQSNESSENKEDGDKIETVIIYLPCNHLPKGVNTNIL